MKKLEKVDGERLSKIVQDRWEKYPSTWVRKGGVNDPLVEHLLIPLQQVSTGLGGRESPCCRGGVLQGGACTAKTYSGVGEPLVEHLLSKPAQPNCRWWGRGGGGIVSIRQIV